MPGKVLFPNASHVNSPWKKLTKRNLRVRSGIKRSPSSGYSLADDLPSLKPPTSYHDFRGDVRSQDVFAEAFEANRKKTQRHLILYPGQDSFELSQYDVWNLDACCTPSLILQPRTSDEVSSCINGYAAGVRKCLSINRYKKSKLDIPRLCIAGGRNSTNTMLDGAIVLDLSLMKAVKVDSVNQVVTIEGGARVSELDRKLGRYGLMAVTGTFKNLGVVGTILSGGIGYGSRKYGLAADNIISAEMVLSDGEIVACNQNMNEDMFWALRGGGGGIGVVTKVTLKCFLLKNAALTTFNLFAPTIRRQKNVLFRWGAWVCKSSNEDGTIAESLPREVYSQLVLSTCSNSITCVATSIDTKVIPQSDLRIEQFQLLKNKSQKKIHRVRRTKYIEKSSPIQWSSVPGLNELIKTKFGALRRTKSQFRLVKYHDELQSFASREWFHTPGNVFMAYKYATSMSPEITKVLAEAISGKKSPKNDSRIFISSAGGAAGELMSKASAFSQRGANFLIFIEGKWFENNMRERAKSLSWVHWVVNNLNNCEGIASTCHTESHFEQVSKTGSMDKHRGWYNFTKENGERIESLKKKIDPRNIFSLGSRISWSYGVVLDQGEEINVVLNEDEFIFNGKPDKIDDSPSNAKHKPAGDSKSTHLRKISDLIKAKVHMISGCQDQQTSADVSNVANFDLPDPAGRAGGACTSAILRVLYNDQKAPDKDLSFQEVLLQMREHLREDGYEQIPQLTSSHSLDVNAPFNIAPEYATNGTKRALLIGINYVGQAGELSGCHNDVINIQTYIITALGFQEDNITVLMDNGYHIDPTRENIMNAYSQLVEESEHGDFVFCHYSGHGGRLQDDQCVDEKDGYDETLVPLDYSEAGQIRDDDLFVVLIGAMPVGVTLTCLMDCCHSGTVLDLPYKFVADGDSEKIIYDEGVDLGDRKGLVRDWAKLNVDLDNMLPPPNLLPEEPTSVVIHNNNTSDGESVDIEVVQSQPPHCSSKENGNESVRAWEKWNVDLDVISTPSVLLPFLEKNPSFHRKGGYSRETNVIVEKV